MCRRGGKGGGAKGKRGVGRPFPDQKITGRRGDNVGPGGPPGEGGGPDTGGTTGATGNASTRIEKKQIFPHPGPPRQLGGGSCTGIFFFFLRGRADFYFEKFFDRKTPRRTPPNRKKQNKKKTKKNPKKGRAKGGTGTWCRVPFCAKRMAPGQGPGESRGTRGEKKKTQGDPAGFAIFFFCKKTPSTGKNSEWFCPGRGGFLGKFDLFPKGGRGNPLLRRGGSLPGKRSHRLCFGLGEGGPHGRPLLGGFEGGPPRWSNKNYW